MQPSIRRSRSRRKVHDLAQSLEGAFEVACVSTRRVYRDDRLSVVPKITIDDDLVISGQRCSKDGHLVRHIRTRRFSIAARRYQSADAGLAAAARTVPERIAEGLPREAIVVADFP